MPRNSLLPESGMRLPVKEILRACMLGSVVVGGATLGREPPAPIALIDVEQNRYIFRLCV